MKTVDIRVAETQLPELVEKASRGESFIIAKAGKPLVMVTALSPCPGSQIHRLGFMAGQFSVPEDFDNMGKEEIEHTLDLVGEIVARHVPSSDKNGMKT